VDFLQLRAGKWDGKTCFLNTNKEVLQEISASGFISKLLHWLAIGRDARHDLSPRGTTSCSHVPCS